MQQRFSMLTLAVLLLASCASSAGTTGAVKSYQSTSTGSNMPTGSGSTISIPPLTGAESTLIIPPPDIMLIPTDAGTSDGATIQTGDYRTDESPFPDDKDPAPYRASLPSLRERPTA